MADDLSIALEGVDDLLTFYASLKGIPLEKVLFHAAKDVAYTAYQNTPTAKARKAPRFALLPGRGSKQGKVVKVNLATEEQRETSRKHRLFKDRSKRWKKSGHLKRLKAYQIGAPARGFARSLFIPLFQSLGFTTKKPRQSDASAFDRYSSGVSTFATMQDPYGGGFKEKVAGFARSAMQPGATFSATEMQQGDTPSAGFSIRQPALSSSQHATWSATAAQKGFARAGELIMKDLRRCLSNPLPAKTKIDQL